jgi:hypothetical protein
MMSVGIVGASTEIGIEHIQNINKIFYRRRQLQLQFYFCQQFIVRYDSTLTET